MEIPYRRIHFSQQTSVPGVLTGPRTKPTLETRSSLHHFGMRSTLSTKSFYNPLPNCFEQIVHYVESLIMLRASVKAVLRYILSPNSLYIIPCCEKVNPPQKRSAISGPWSTRLRIGKYTQSGWSSWDFCRRATPKKHFAQVEAGNVPWPSITLETESADRPAPLPDHLPRADV